MLIGIILAASAVGGFAIFSEDRVVGAVVGFVIGVICSALVAL